MIAIVTGLLAGLVHVLAGPDHLAAIAPLATDRPRGAWSAGMRWGLGHSAGVALVALLSLLLRDLIPVDLISSWGERFVGVMLFGIGLWAWRKALRHSVHVHSHQHNGDQHVHVHAHNHRADHDHPKGHVHTHAAFGIGTLHGLAGSSHFLGVLPVLAFPSRAEAVSYLVMFAVGTVAAMAGFAWFIGSIAARFSARSVSLHAVLARSFAVTAMCMGCFWLYIGFR